MSRIIPLGIYRCSVILPLPVHIIIPSVSSLCFCSIFNCFACVRSSLVCNWMRRCDMRHLQTSCLVQALLEKPGHTCLRWFIRPTNLVNQLNKELLPGYHYYQLGGGGVIFFLRESLRLLIRNIVKYYNLELLLSHDASEIILICWFCGQETFLIIIFLLLKAVVLT